MISYITSRFHVKSDEPSNNEKDLDKLIINV